MIIRLTTFERLTMKGWLERQEGNIGFIRQAVPVAQKLELDEDERRQIGFRQSGATMQWQDTEYLFEVELRADELELFRPMLSAKWPATMHHLEMLEKLEDVVLVS